MSAKSKARTLGDHPRVPLPVRSEVASRGDHSPDEDAVTIGNLYRKGREAVRDSINFYLQAGQKLIDKKKSVPRGAWLRWLRSNAETLGFTNRTTASRLMKLAAANEALTHPFNEAKAVQISRQLWGNLP
jgi:hypothetical protein